MIRKALGLMTGNATGAMMMLARNLLVARLISVGDFGIAATFAMIMALIEMASNLGLQQLIVQSRKGDDPRLQAGLQGFNVLRGLVSGAILFLLADPLASFLNVPEIAWAYQVLALIPVLRGFEHFDVHRMNRAMDFRPLILTKTVPPLISVLCVWPLFQIFGDWRVMLYAVLLQWVLTLITGHLMARRRYRLTIDLAVMRQGFGFGWPLLINNLLLFVVFQGDKMVVGRELGMEVLAIFAMGVLFTLSPTMVMAQSVQQFMLPQLSSAADKGPDFHRLTNTALQAGLLNGLILVAAIALLGPWLVGVVLGAKYAALQPLLIWFALGQAVRVFKAGSSTVALSRARTSNPMIANFFRVSVLPLTWYLAIQGVSLETIVLVTVLAELVSFAVSMGLLATQVGHTFRGMGPSMFLTGLGLGLVALGAVLGPETAPWLQPAWIAPLALAVAFAAMRDLHRYLHAQLKA